MKALLSILAFCLAAWDAMAAGWVKTGLPAYHVITCLLEGDRGAIFVGTDQHGLQRSLDGGATWTRIKTPFGYSHRVLALAKGPEGYIFLSQGVDVALSQDNGDTWATVARPPILADVLALAYDSKTARLYAGGRNGICSSFNFGSGWTHEGPINETVRVLHAGTDGAVYAGCSGSGQLGGMLRSDPISKWSHIGLEHANVKGVLFAHAYLFAGFDNGSSNKLAGLEFGFPGTWYGFTKGLPDSGKAAVHALGVGADKALYAAPARGVYLSLDLSKGWSPAGLDSLQVRSMLSHSNSAVFAGTLDGGLWKTGGPVAVLPAFRKPHASLGNRHADMLGREPGLKTRSPRVILKPNRPE